MTQTSAFESGSSGCRVVAMNRAPAGGQSPGMLRVGSPWVFIEIDHRQGVVDCGSPFSSTFASLWSMVRNVKAGRWISAGSSSFFGAAGKTSGADFFIGSRAISLTGGGVGVDSVAAGSDEQAARTRSRAHDRRVIGPPSYLSSGPASNILGPERV